VRFEETRRPPLVVPALILVEHALALREQEIAEEGVIPVGRLHTRAAVREEMPLVQFLEDLLGRRISGQFSGDRNRHLRKQGGEDQELPRRLGHLPEDLGGEVVEEHVALGERIRRGDFTAAAPFEHQSQAGGPPPAFGVQPLDLLGGQIAARRNDRLCLLDRQPQIVPVDEPDVVVGDEARVAAWRIAATDRHQGLVFGHLCHGVCDYGVEGLVRAYLLVVVEHQECSAGQQIEQIAKEAPREPGNVMQIFRG
jgi:hypothetical protein